MTYTVFMDGRFLARFATREGALGYIQHQQKPGAEFEICDESDEL
jgi:hypothetical protein